MTTRTRTRPLGLGPGAIRPPETHILRPPNRQPIIILPPTPPVEPDLDPDTNPAIAAFCDLIADIIISAVEPVEVDSAQSDNLPIVDESVQA